MAIARERVGSSRVVVGLSIVMPTTKQWGKVEVGLGFDNTELFGTSVQTYLESLKKNWKIPHTELEVSLYWPTKKLTGIQEFPNYHEPVYKHIENASKNLEMYIIQKCIYVSIMT